MRASVFPSRRLRHALAVAVLGTACARAAPAIGPAPVSSAAAPPAPATTVSVASGSAPTAAPPAASAIVATVLSTDPAPADPLATFRAALGALARGERKDHVRIAWLGDSHAQADHWPDFVRTALQARFGAAGPGFVHLGYEPYRHGGVLTDTNGQWRMRPKQPSTTEPWGDGAFGLGGILHAGYAGPRWAYVELTDPALDGRRLRWDLCYKFGTAGDKFTVTLGDGEARRFQADTLHTLQHVVFEGTGRQRLTVRPTEGRPDFCGLVVETLAEGGAGVVLDTLGINGAQYATPLAWNEEAWAAELTRRPPPELFIVEYGGNEAGTTPIEPERYAAHLEALVARLRRVRKDASCLAIGLSDRMDAEDRIVPIRDATREAAVRVGCAFWDTYDRMGGRGSLRRWREDRRADEDGVHLTPQGYAEVGRWLFDDLVATP